MRRRGFTLVELLVVLAIIGVLLGIAVPRYFKSEARAKESVLKEDLRQMREAIQQYYADKGKYPEKIETLAAEKYLRQIPPDPITGSTETWIAVSPQNPEKSGVYDVKSGAPGAGIDGKAYAEM